MAVIWIEDFESTTGATSQAGVTRAAPNRTNVNGDNDELTAAVLTKFYASKVTMRGAHQATYGLTPMVTALETEPY